MQLTREKKATTKKQYKTINTDPKKRKNLSFSKEISMKKRKEKVNSPRRCRKKSSQNHIFMFMWLFLLYLFIISSLLNNFTTSTMCWYLKKFFCFSFIQHFFCCLFLCLILQKKKLHWIFKKNLFIVYF